MLTPWRVTPDRQVSGHPRTGPRTGLPWANYALLLAVVAIAVLPLVSHGPSCGQDFDFHLQNWMEANRSWHQGVLYPHWAASANYGAGEPRFVFYPPLSWMLGGVLGSVLPWNWTPLAFALLALLGAGFSFRAMAGEWMSDDAATLGACLYAVNPYMLFTLYERGALAELLAATWLPLLVLYGLRKKPALLPLGLVIAAIWLTDAPAGVMGCYLLAVLVAVAAVRTRTWALVRRSAAAAPLGLGLAAFWLVPAWYEERWVQIGRVIGPLMRVQDSFLFGFVKLGGPSLPSAMQFSVEYHNEVLRTVSWIVVALTAATATAALLSHRRRSPVWLPLAVAAAGIAALQLRWSDPLWKLLPELRFLQFAWRWMLVLGLILAALAGLVLDRRAPLGRDARTGDARRLPKLHRPMHRRMHRIVSSLGILLLAAGLAALASRDFRQPCDEEDNVDAQLTTFHTTGFEGTDEYTLRGIIAPQLAGVPGSGADTAAAPLLTAAQPLCVESLSGDGRAAEPVRAEVQVERWGAEHMTAMVRSPRPGYALLRLMDYPAWRVTRNGVNAVGRTRRSDGLMAVPVEAGANRIDVRWVATGDAWAGRAISLAALAITLALALKERRKAGRVH